MATSDSTLGPGFRFHPTDEELVLYYLKRRVSGKSLRFDPIAVVDVYKAEPWDLPGQSKLNTKDLEWYFFSSLETKYGNGWRTNRATQQGYWKTTGKDRTVKHGERVVGMKKTLVFHIGRAPKGERTNWVMHEYRLVEEELEKVGLKQASFVLCRVFEKSGSGPKNGEQYGAPFVEEEWEEDDVLDTGREDSDDLKYLQYHNGEGQDLAAEVTPLNAVLAESSGGDSCNYIQEPLGFEEEDQKNLIGLDKNARMLPGEQELKERFQVAEQYQMPEQFQMDQEPVQNEFFEVEALLGLGESGLTYNDALPPVKTEFENGFSNSVESGADFDIDDYIKYFDASDLDLTNGVSYDSFGVPVSEGPLLNQPTLDNEVTNCNSQAYMGPAGPSNGYYGEGPSDQKPVIPKVMEDVQCEDWNNSTFTKQISRMLGAIPAPDAFAAESPVKKAALGQNPGAHASSSIHVTAGMIHITGVISGGRNVWSLGKGGDAPVLLSSEITFGDELTISNLINSMVPMRDIMSNKVPSLMMRSGYYFFLFWIMILSVSCRIGSYIYSR